jgi:hypothetical protein
MRPARPSSGSYRPLVKFASIDDRFSVFLVYPYLSGDHPRSLEVQAQQACIVANGHPVSELVADRERLQLCSSPYTRIPSAIPYPVIARALSSMSRPVEAHFPNSTTGWSP